MYKTLKSVKLFFKKLPLVLVQRQLKPHSIYCTQECGYGLRGYGLRGYGLRGYGLRGYGLSEVDKLWL